MKGNAGGVGFTPNGRLRLQGIGCVKVKWHRPIPAGATLGEVKVTRCFGGRTAARYDVAFSVEVPDRTTRHPKCAAVGLDVGIRTFARLSTGEAVEGPRASGRGRANLRRLSRAHARTRPGSRRRAKAAGRIARARERERNRRRDAAHKASRSIARRFALVAVEDLNLQGMLRSGPGKSAPNREIADQGWGQFLLMLAYKAEEAGGRVVCVNPRGSSQTCARCGERDRRSRRGATFCCTACGHRADADVNAAEVLLGRALVEVQGPGRGLQATTDALASVA